MSIIVDKKFINLVSIELRNFKWKKESQAQCSCPICGDSKKDAKKARGYFYQKHGRFFYKCFNCGYWSNIYRFLSQVSPDLCKEYGLESFKGNINNDQLVRKEKKKNDYTVKDEEEMARGLSFGRKPIKKIRDGYKVLGNATKLKDLPKDHPAVKFADARLIPKEYWGILYYTDDFGSFAKGMDSETKFLEKEERLIIPFFNSHGDVVAVQGRAINMTDEMNARKTIKYLTVKCDKSIDRLFYGLWRCDPEKRVYIVEGPLDSLFVKNAIAMVGAGAINKLPERLQNKDVVFVLDNEPRNEQIVKFNEELINQGRQVCIWPESISEKDINDMSYRISTRKIRKIIDENTFSGLEAKVKLNKWKKI